jgi:hypothetical protein
MLIPWKHMFYNFKSVRLNNTNTVLPTSKSECGERSEGEPQGISKVSFTGETIDSGEE